LLRDPDGRLSDEDTGRTVTPGELLDGLRSDQRFRVRLRTTGVDCTSEVLLELLVLALPGFGGADPAAPAEPLRALLFGRPAPDRRGAPPPH
jgi:hypothetical protein